MLKDDELLRSVLALILNNQAILLATVVLLDGVEAATAANLLKAANQSTAIAAQLGNVALPASV